MSPFTGRQASIDWDKLRIFHGVARAGSLTRASERMGLSQSALSRQIAALEEALQTPLFHRHARGLSLTEAGEMLYRTAHEMDHRLTAARTRLMDAKDKPYGPLRVTATVGLGSIWLTPRLKEFIELYPDIQVSLLLFNEELDLARGEADVAIRLRQPVQPDLIQRKLFTVHNHIYAAPSYIKAHGFPRTVEELDRHSILSFGPAPGYLASVNWLTTVGRPAGNPRQPVQPDLIQRKLFTVHNHIYAAPSYIKARGFPRTVEELDRHSILSFGPAPGYLASVNWLTTVGRPAGNPRQPVLTVNNVYGLRRAVESGIGIASLPDYVVGPSSPLVQVDIAGSDLPYFDTYFVYPAELKTSKRVRVFRDFLIPEARAWKF